MSFITFKQTSNKHMPWKKWDYVNVGCNKTITGGVKIFSKSICIGIIPTGHYVMLNCTSISSLSCVFSEPTVETVEALEPKRNNYVGKTLFIVMPTV